jgi:hypothetical protein
MVHLPDQRVLPAVRADELRALLGMRSGGNRERASSCLGEGIREAAFDPMLTVTIVRILGTATATGLSGSKSAYSALKVVVGFFTGAAPAFPSCKFHDRLFSGMRIAANGAHTQPASEEESVEANRVRTAASSALLLTALSCAVGQAAPLPYSFSVDRFSLVGNVAGSFVDEFDDGVVAPWQIVDPPASEANGLVTFRDPGSMQPPQRVGHIAFTPFFNYIRSPVVVENGQGNFASDSNWVPILPSVNQQYGMTLTYGVPPNEDVFIHVFNFAPAIADLLGFPSGPVIGFGRFPHGQDVALAQGEAVPINQSQITGQIILRLTFDDQSDLFRGAFSLNGGSSFESPFDPVTSRQGDTPGRIYLGSESWQLQQAVPEPSTLVLLIAAVAGLLSLSALRRFPIEGDDMGS